MVRDPFADVPSESRKERRLYFKATDGLLDLLNGVARNPDKLFIAEIPFRFIENLLRRVVGYLIVSVLVALLITGATFFVTEFPNASVPGVPGASGGALVRGFPLPYLTIFCCGIVDGIDLSNASYLHESNLAADFAIWLVVSMVGVLTFSVRRLLVAATAEVGLTLFTLLLRPLSLVAPGYGMETDILRPMGFPYEYVTYYVGGLLGATTSGYDFNLSAALADYALWTGIALALAGIVVTIIRRGHHDDRKILSR